MAGKPSAVVFLGILVILLAFVATTGESRRLRITKHIALFDPSTLCKDATQYAKLCERVASREVDGIRVTSPATLVEASVATAINSAEKVSVQVASLMKSSSDDYKGIMGSALQACKESYDSTIDALQQSQTLLKDRGSHDDLMTQLSAASTFVTTCSDSLAEVGEVSYPPEKAHSLLDRLVSNSLDLGAKLNSHNENKLF